jgi:hypothetical protein
MESPAEPCPPSFEVSLDGTNRRPEPVGRVFQRESVQATEDEGNALGFRQAGQFLVQNG